MQEMTLLALAARSADVTGDAEDVADDVREMAVYLNITAVSGTSPTLDVVVEDSPDGSVWATLATFSTKTAVGVDVVRANRLGRYVRARATIGGTTPSFTFEVKAIGR
ncbi:MAG: hypothetical protein GXP39_07955 [Chloroflexi bacterium]|nr:hypothetical protein [Chloroflexota bacterium]